MNIYAISGLGGSGTRIVAQILRESGIFMGNDLNESNDNLTFSYLFKRAKSYKKRGSGWIYDYLSIFEKYMSGQNYNVRDIFLLMKSFVSKEYYSYRENTKRLFNLLYKKPQKIKNDTSWGWKEPNTFIYLNQVINHFPNLKYIHVIRHGLDMAYTNTLQQLYHWGFWKA